MKKKIKTQLDNVPSRMLNGRKLFTLENFVNAQRRVEPVPEQKPQGDLFSGEEKTEENPDVQLENAGAGSGTPAEDGMTRQRWRLISADMLWPTSDWGLRLLVDYGTHDNGKALKAGVGIINSKNPDLMKDHSQSIKDVFGQLENSKWEASTDIKPGINADLTVDPELFADESKRLEKGIYRSGSIGITTELAKSHPDMDDWDFIEKQGQKVKGEIVRLLLVKVTDIRHMAVVPAGSGADKNAGLRNVASTDTQNNSSVGGLHMEKWLWDLINEACGLLKYQALTEGVTEPPEGFEAGFKKQITALLAERAAINDLNAKLTDLGEKFSLKDAEGKIEPVAVLAALPERLKKAEWGDVFLTRLREETTKAFDAAKADPEQKELSELDQKLRKRIGESSDPEYLTEMLEHYGELAKGRFALNRSSRAQELPNVGGANKDVRTGQAALISEGVNALFRRRNKEGGAK